MGLATHRLVIMMLAINLLIGVAGEIYKNPDVVDTGLWTESTTEYEAYEVDAQTNQSIFGTVKGSTDRQQEPHVGNPLTWGWSLIKLFFKSIWPFGLVGMTFETTLESFMAIVLTMFRVFLMSGVIILEGYMLFINKKQS